jgi:Flp pilus assembly protein TadD
MGRILVVLAVVLGLAGCASAPQPKAQLNEQGYTAFATHLMVLGSCAQQGLITPELAASGNRYLKSQLAGYTYSEEKLKSSLVDFAGHNPLPGKADCNTLAVQISELNQQNASNLAQSQADAQEMADLTKQLQNSVPAPVYCNRLGTQTFCN